MERVIPEQSKIEKTEISSSLPEVKIGDQNRFSGYLMNKYASNVLIVCDANRICYAGRKAKEFLAIENASFLSDIENDILKNAMLLGIQEAIQSEGSYYLHNLAYLAGNKLERLDFQFTALTDISAEEQMVEIELLSYSTKPCRPDLDEKQLLSTLKVQELLNENHFLNNFVTGASHDLKGPMVVIKSYVDLIRRFKTPEKKNEALDVMKSAANKLESILKGLEEMVNFRFEDQRKLNALSIEKVFASVCEHLDYEINLILPTINTDFEAAPEIRYTRAYLFSIFYNLLSNSLKYRKIGEQLKISVKVHCVDDKVMITFKDNGIGMDLEKYGHLLFEPFSKTVYRAGRYRPGVMYD